MGEAPIKWCLLIGCPPSTVDCRITHRALCVLEESPDLDQTSVRRPAAAQREHYPFWGLQAVVGGSSWLSKKGNRRLICLNAIVKYYQNILFTWMYPRIRWEMGLELFFPVLCLYFLCPSRLRLTFGEPSLLLSLSFTFSARLGSSALSALEWTSFYMWRQDDERKCLYQAEQSTRFAPLLINI